MHYLLWPYHLSKISVPSPWGLSSNIRILEVYMHSNHRSLEVRKIKYKKSGWWLSLSVSLNANCNVPVSLLWSTRPYMPCTSIPINTVTCLLLPFLPFLCESHSPPCSSLNLSGAFASHIPFSCYLGPEFPSQVTIALQMSLPYLKLFHYTQTLPIPLLCFTPLHLSHSNIYILLKHIQLFSCLFFISPSST